MSESPEQRDPEPESETPSTDAPTEHDESTESAPPEDAGDETPPHGDPAAALSEQDDEETPIELLEGGAR